LIQSRFVVLVGAAGRRVAEDELENMLESDDTNIFTQDVSWPICSSLLILSKGTTHSCSSKWTNTHKIILEEQL